MARCVIDAYERALAEQPREHGPDHPTHKHPRVPGEPYCPCFEHGFHVCAAEHWAVLCGEINYERRVAEQPREEEDVLTLSRQVDRNAALVGLDRHAASRPNSTPPKSWPTSMPRSTPMPDSERFPDDAENTRRLNAWIDSTLPAPAVEEQGDADPAEDAQPDMHAAYLGRCIEATEVERDQAQAALTTERHRTQVAEGERDEARAEVERLREALQVIADGGKGINVPPMEFARRALAASQEETP